VDTRVGWGFRVGGTRVGFTVGFDKGVAVADAGVAVGNDGGVGEAVTTMIIGVGAGELDGGFDGEHTITAMVASTAIDASIPLPLTNQSRFVICGCSRFAIWCLPRGCRTSITAGVS